MKMYIATLVSRIGITLGDSSRLLLSSVSETDQAGSPGSSSGDLSRGMIAYELCLTGLLASAVRSSPGLPWWRGG